MEVFNDCHIHCNADTSGKDILKAMDKVGMEKAVLLSPHWHESNEREIESIDTIARVIAPDPERLIGFAWIEPTLSEAVDHVAYAVNDKKLKGIKMIPDHWYPYEERLFPVYRKIEEFRKPILFHSGILYGNGDSSRFCRPCFYEVMLHFPRVRFALAHISWPWTDECIATFGRMTAAAGWEHRDRVQMYIDITRGTPRYYRTEALTKALLFAGPSRLIYGSDASVPVKDDFKYAREGIDVDRDIIVNDLGYTAEDFDLIARRNLDDFLQPLDF